MSDEITGRIVFQEGADDLLLGQHRDNRLTGCKTNVIQRPEKVRRVGYEPSKIDTVLGGHLNHLDISVSRQLVVDERTVLSGLSHRPLLAKELQHGSKCGGVA